MAVNKQQTYGDTPYSRAVQITSADGTTKKDLAVADANGAGLRIDFVRISTDLAANQAIGFYYYDAATGLTNPLGVQTLPAYSGSLDGSSAVVAIFEAMPDILPDSLLLKAGDKLQVAPTGAITAGKTIWVTALGMDLTAS